MREIRYADAGMDLKKTALCFLGKIWLVILAAAAGAALGAAIYEASHVVPESEREYRAVSKVYLDFAPDETGEVYQAYNGYTWNDLIATDPILDVTMSYLPEGYTRQEVMEATEAEILSDLRLLTITVTTHDKESCDAIIRAVGRSLTERGNTAKEFKKIEVIQTTESSLVVADSRTVQAVLVGTVVCAVLMLLGMMLYYILDDRILVASDLRQVTDVPFAGYAKALGALGRAYDDNLLYLREKWGDICVLDIIQGQEITDGQWTRLREADGAVVAVAFGQVHAAYLGYIMEQLKLREIRIVGVAIGDADGRFLGRYYGRAIGKQR